MKFPFIGHAYTAISSVIQAQECINLYLEIDPDGRNALIQCPGLKLFCTAGYGPVRGIYKPANYDAIAISGNSVYRITSAGTATLLGTIGTSVGVVSMADNGTDLIIVDGSSTGYKVALSSYTLSTIVSAGFYGADRVFFSGGRFILNKPGTGQFYISGLYAVTFDPLDFATAESAPDNVVSLIVDREDIFLPGDQTTEQWVLTTNADFPYERANGGTLQVGCAAKHSVCRFDNTIIWLGKNEKGDSIVWLWANSNALRVSTHAIENELRTYSDVSDAFGYVYQSGGHEFYVLTFPTAEKTWVYDAATKAWHQRAYLNSDGTLTRHRSNCYAFAYGKHLVGDFENGNIYELDQDTYTDNGDPIQWTRSCEVIQDPDFKRIFFNKLQIEMATGVGNITGAGSDPVVGMSYSDDGGRTWSNERTASMGKIGEYFTRIIWWRMGSAFSRIYRLRGSEPVKTVIVGASLNG